MTVKTTDAAPPPAKKQRISLFRRALWHVNRTDLGWVTKSVLSALDGNRVRRRGLLAMLPTDPAWAEASRRLTTEGYVEITELMDRALAEACSAHADEKVSRWKELQGRQELGHKSFWVSLLDEDLLEGMFATDHPFVRYALQPAALRIIGDFMMDLPQLSDVLLTLSVPTEDRPLAYSQLWHLDHDDKRVCKLFIYLSDVQSTDDGPFTFIPAGPSGTFRNTVRSHMEDKEVFAKVARDSAQQLIAPRLASFIVNTARCLHMGSRIRSGHSRLLYTATYIQPPRIYPEPPPRFRACAPLNQIEQAVMHI